MSKSIVIISGLVDNTIREYQKDVTFHIFRTLEELDTYIERTPIRAQTMFFTRDVIPLANTSLNYLISLMDKVFFKVDDIVYITEPESPEIASIKFLVKSKDYDNWEIIQGALTREYVAGVINGNARSDFSNVKRKAVYRIPKADYVKERSKHSDLLESERYKDDDESIQEMPNEKMPVYLPPERTQVCNLYDIVGEDCEERTLFTFIMAQYLATHGKTLIIERDWQYHRLGEYVTKSGVDCEVIYIDDIYVDIQKVIKTIVESPKNLITVLAKRKIEYNYSFIFNLLYNNLINNLAYAIREASFGEEPTESNYTVVFPNTMYSVLSMCDKVNMNFLKHTKFVAIHMDTLTGLRLPTQEAITAILEDVLSDTAILPVELLSINTLKMGTDGAYDLRRVLWT